MTQRAETDSSFAQRAARYRQDLELRKLTDAGIEDVKNTPTSAAISRADCLEIWSRGDCENT